MQALDQRPKSILREFLDGEAAGGIILMVAAALALTGYVSAKLSRANTNRAMLRNVLGGVFAMGVTLLVGHLVGTAV